MEPITASVNDSARLIGVSRATVYNWMSQGKIESVRVGGRRLVKLASIRRLVGETA